MKLFRTLLLFVVACTSAAAPAADSVETQLLAVITNWGNALINRDARSLEKVLATEFEGIGSMGETFNRDQYLSTTTSEAYVLKSFTFSGLKVREYGGFVLLTVVNTAQATYEGKDESGQYRVTAGFVKRDGRWQCVATHASSIVKQP